MTPEERPKLKIQLTPTDQVLELLDWNVLLVLWVWIGTSYSNLPDSIPTHFNAAGEADNFERKASIVSLPIIATLLYIGLTLLNRVPQILIPQDTEYTAYLNSGMIEGYL